MKTYFDNIFINITKQQLNQLPTAGDCTESIIELSKEPTIKRQLNKIPQEKYFLILHQYGAWDELELEDYEENKLRLLWIASGNLLEN
jgi:hypothetical protein